MAPDALPSGIQIIRALDRIRDEAADLPAMCRDIADYLQRELSLLEVHVLVRDPETGSMDNPAPDRPQSSDVLTALREGEAGNWSTSVRRRGVHLHPVCVRGRTLGVLVTRTARAEDESAGMDRLTDLALAIVDSALENAIDRQELSERNRELEAIFEMDRIRDEHPGLEALVDRVAHKLLDTIPCSGSAVVLHNELSGSVDIHFPSSRWFPRLQDEDCLACLRDLAFQSFRMRDLVSADLAHASVGSALCAPLILNENIVGAFLVVRHEHRPYTLAERRLLAAMASQIDTALFEDQERQRIKSVFKRYVSDEVVDEMLGSDRHFLAGQRRELTVLFSDLRGFTAASERLDTEIVVEMLNQHLATMAGVVLDHRGTLDKFIGDCVMAFWGAPVDEPDHAFMTVKTAVDMRSVHGRLREDWRRQGLPPIHIGIGVNTGEMFVGNIGDQRKSSYTVIGDNVNLAARLEGVAQGGQILVSASTFEAIRGRVVVEELDPVRVRGKKKPVVVFNVTGIR